MRPLTPKQQRFVAEYLKDLNATQAAIRAGFSERTAAQIGYEYLRKPQIAAAVAEATAAQLEKADLSAARVKEEMRRIGFFDVRSLFHSNGRLKGMHELSAEQGAAIASLEVIVKNAEAGDGHQDVVHKLKVWDKPRVLEMLGKHFGLLVERLEHQGELRISWEE